MSSKFIYIPRSDHLTWFVVLIEIFQIVLMFPFATKLSLVDASGRGRNAQANPGGLWQGRVLLVRFLARTRK